MTETSPGFVDNEPADYNPDRDVVVVKASGEVIPGNDRTRVHLIEEVFWIGGVPYYWQPERERYVKVTLPSETVSLKDMKKRLENGAVMEKLAGEAFQKRWKDVWDQARSRYQFEGSYRPGNRAPLKWAYVDNEQHLYDPEKQEFTREGKTVDLEEARKKGMHVSSLLAVKLVGRLFYMDERLREFRRIGDPSERKTYDDYDELVDRGITLEIPSREEFRKLMVVERELIRELTDPDADNDRR